MEQFRAARKSLDETHVPANIKDTKKYADLAPERRLAWKNIEHFDYFKYETAGTCWKNGNKEAEKEKRMQEASKNAPWQDESWKDPDGDPLDGVEWKK